MASAGVNFTFYYVPCTCVGCQFDFEYPVMIVTSETRDVPCIEVMKRRCYSFQFYRHFVYNASVAGLISLKLRFIIRAFSIGFVVDKVVLGQGSFMYFDVCLLLIIIVPLLHDDSSFMYHQCCVGILFQWQ